MIKLDNINKIIENGASLDKDLQPIKENKGFMCSIIGMEKTFKPENIQEITATIETYQSKLKANQYIGVWNYNGLVYVDISRHYKHKQDALRAGIINKQRAIFDLGSKKDIYITKKNYILYRYNKALNDISFIKEYNTIKEMENDLQKTYNTLKSYIINSIDEPIKELLQDRYIIIKENVLMFDE